MKHLRGIPYRLPSGRWFVYMKCEDGQVRRFTTPEIRTPRRPVRTRFDVLARDDYTCQYCGAKAPAVVLHVDHLVPVAKGGTDEPANLITACKDCNEGKGPRHSGAIVDERPDLYETMQDRQRKAMDKFWRDMQDG